MKLHKLSLYEAKEGLDKKEFSAKELVTSTFSRINEVDEKINAFISVDEETAISKAEEIDDNRAKGEKLPPYAGVPVAIKDNMCTDGIKTTCASKILENFVPPFDATVVKMLRDTGFIMVGKTNLDEFAMGSSTENSAFFTTKNPWDLNKVPGGSSGGSAASVASAEVPLALGSDTGGSIRQPAAFCGVVGFKPTYGRVSRYGLVAFASSFDQIGPFARNVKDVALSMNVISGHDEMDSTSADIDAPDFTKSLDKGVNGMKIGIPEEYFQLGVKSEIKNVVKNAINTIDDQGAMVEDISLPTTEYALTSYYLISPAEASSNLARFDGVRYGTRLSDENLKSLYYETRSQGFGEEVKRRIMLGNYALSSGYYDDYYLKGLKVRTLIKREFEDIFGKYDVLMAPTTPTLPFNIGEQIDDPATMYLNDICTVPVNLAGLPAISVPCGFVEGNPVGIQIIGKPFDEAKVLQVASELEKTLNLGQKIPGES
ncbi:Asp-tRNA(Asn)/Glu-tRNA(Gln) amidotransferase subunit GatA [Natranaerofaba carboxydovora]|uniref:Asp-tRNA(Asn)/Glu-tRNA(Gln) amidotransferase subunit GatA n=1 Tax=Natranaerofaba carboxydovora TaxID=2742683 RepID=UPI001F141500|nr:Asp-tRNA(Asn)/Glu-tRNA(Gln) amidotransferase subunit GatA [Natranaerofaba carboxydovora]UMZ74531.1 Glutamyl-tRNA(Gln) amidotransferase subunit A [Natranaerofaba carboxydovora]